MTITEILHQVWKRSEGGLVFLPIKDHMTGEWNERSPVAPHEVQHTALDQPEEIDLFFTPVQYVAGPRTADNQGQVGVLYADLDQDYDAAMLEHIPPTLLWETSPGSMQAIWFLDRPVPAAQAIGLNRRLSHLMSADMGSWIATKVLRIPGTINWKRGGVEGHLISWDDGVVYSVDRLEDDLPPVPTISRGISTVCPPVPTISEHRALLEKAWPKLDHRTKQMLLLPEVPDRSLHLTRLANQMLKLSIDPPEIFGILSRLPTNKFRGRDHILWNSVILTAIVDPQ